MYSLDEVGLIPARISDINSRKDVNPFRDGYLPIFVAPMTCLIKDVGGLEKFTANKFIPILPVWHDNAAQRAINKLVSWTAVTLQEFTEFYTDSDIAREQPFGAIHHVLIDTASGNMSQTLKAVKKAKFLYGKSLKVMIGNIAEPETYCDCTNAGVDYVRIGIGGGNGCTTSVQTGIHTSIPYILEGIKTLKGIHSIKYPNTKYPKIIADGGIDSIGKAIKALALGADYVMMGYMFAQCEDIKVNYECYPRGDNTYQQNFYYGQSSKEGQKDRFGTVKAHPEGTGFWVMANTTLQDFSYDFESALRSAMSQTNAKTLDDFIGKVKYEYMTPKEFNSFNK